MLLCSSSLPVGYVGIHLIFVCILWYISYDWCLYICWNLQGPAMEPIQNDTEREEQYADVLRLGLIDIVDDNAVEEEMAAALKEYDQIGADLGVIPSTCKYFTEDPSWLTRLIIGEEEVQRI